MHIIAINSRLQTIADWVKGMLNFSFFFNIRNQVDLIAKGAIGAFLLFKFVT